jgi:hypothetical protein
VRLNSSAPNESLLLGHFRRTRWRRRRRTSVRRLFRRKRLSIRGKRWKQRSSRGLYNVNYAKQPIRRQRKPKRLKKRLKERRNTPKKSEINKPRPP